MTSFRTQLSAAIAAAALFVPATASACACGCGVFDVGDGTVTPVNSDSGFSLWFRFARMVQNQNREGGSRAPAADNADKRIATNFYTIGAEYMVNRRWSVMAELPLYQRSFTTTDDGTYAAPAGTIDTRRLTDLGDMMLRVKYTGFSPDMSTGLGLGIKLPTGRYTSPTGPLGGEAFDHDTLPGTGSTDLTVSGYHVGPVHGPLAWFVQAQYQFAVATRDGYRPGNELDGAVGLSYDLGANAHGLGLVPTLQLIGSVRNHDSGINSDPDNTGYRRLLIAPGLKINLSRKLALYGDVEFPVAQHVRSAPPPPASDSAGQLVAPVQFKLQVNYGF